MRAPRRSDLALCVGATTAAGVLVLLDDEGWAEWLFGSFMLSCLAVLGRLGVDAWRSASAERLRVQDLEATPPAAVARAAVARERERLAGEVEACIRHSLRQVAAEIDALDVALPVPGLQRVHALTRRTTSELRRQLGLLREEASVAESSVEPGTPSARNPVSGRRALIEGLVVAGIAAVESTLQLLNLGQSERLPWSVVVTVLAAATVAGRAARPGTAIMACAGLITAGSVFGYPVSSGFWIMITLGVLVWTVAATPVARLRSALTPAATIVLLLGVLVWSFRRDDPDNLGVLLVVVVVAATGGILVGSQRWGEARARAAAQSRERVLGEAADDAVRGERVLVARELHDVVSHAVGVIALQAAAAELSWPRDQGAVERAVEVIRRTTADTLADLDRLTPTADGAAHTVDDLIALVERVRLAGTPVDLTVVGDASAHADVVHRVVQESLTNAMRHAPGATVTVRVRCDSLRTEVSVSNDGPIPRQPPGRGYGLVGLAERVEFAHGSFDSGPGPEGRGFRVVAAIPPPLRRENDWREHTMSVRVTVVDDNELLRAGLVTVLRSDPEVDVLAESGDGPAGVRAAVEHKPDVVLMDVEMPGGDGLTATARLLEQLPQTRVLILTMFDLDEYVHEALRAGASGFLLKTTEPHALIAAVKGCAAGETTLGPTVVRRLVESFVDRPAPVPPPGAAELTDRERDVLRAMARGLSNAEIALDLHLAETTVKTHVAHILAKLGVRDRVRAVVLALQSGLAHG